MARGAVSGLLLSAVVLVIAVALAPGETRLESLASAHFWTQMAAVIVCFTGGGAGAGAVFAYTARFKRDAVSWIARGMAMASVMWGSAGLSIPFLDTPEPFGPAMWLASTLSAAVLVGPVLGLVLFGVGAWRAKRGIDGR